VRLLWGVPKALFGVLPGRVTYVIDKTGKCISVTDDIGNAAKHPADALKALSA
jgi:thioredoxin-dependent peroxiredoxin